MLKLDASIVPGVSAAGLRLGDPVQQIQSLAVVPRRRLDQSLEHIELGPVSVWIREGLIDQIGVAAGYRGAVAGTDVGIGSTLRQVSTALGEVFENDEDGLCVDGMPGICLETTLWADAPGRETVAHNLDAKIIEIYVFRPS